MKRILLRLISLILIIVCMSGILEIWKWHQYSTGRAALNQESWSTAFYRFRRLTAVFPNYRDAQNLLAEAGEGMARTPSEHSDHAAVIDLMLWLDESKQMSLLAQIIDKSLAQVPAGTFMMGSDEGHSNERPVVQVYVDAYEIDRFEVTNVQFQRYIEAMERPPPRYWNGNMYPEGSARLPVVGVSWTDALGYCNWVGKRLPTEAEWEKACRGELGQIYPWGDNWDLERANLNLDRSIIWPDSVDEAWAYLVGIGGAPSQPIQQPVGSYPGGISPYGVLDMVGNASEWVLDWYNWSGYAEMSVTNPVNTEPPWNHSLRGSGWFDLYRDQDLASDQSRCSARNSSHSYDDPRVGFRCAVSLP